MSALPNWKTIDRQIRNDLVRGYVADGLSARQIADKFFDCSRAAVIGMAHRLKIRLHGGQKSEPSTSPRRSKASVSRSPNPKPAKSLIKAANGLLVPVPMRGPNNPHRNDFKGRAEQRAASPGIEIRREYAFDPLPHTLPVAFLDNHGCRWPVDGVNGPGLMVCGAAKDIERSYCNAHRQLSYQAPTVRQTVLLRSAERTR